MPTARSSALLVVACLFATATWPAVAGYSPTWSVALPLGGVAPFYSGVIAAGDLSDGTTLVVAWKISSYWSTDPTLVFHNLSSTGIVLATSTVLLPGLAAPAPEAIVSPDGSVLISSQGSVMKWDGRSGSPLWTAPTPDVPSQRLLVDGSGNVCAASSGASGFVVVRLDGRTGRTLSRQTFPAPLPNVGAQVSSINLEPRSGDLVVAALVKRFTVPEVSWAVLRCDGAGRLRWSVTLDLQSFVDPAPPVGQIAHVATGPVAALDADGDLVLAGGIVSPSYREGVTAVKLSGRTGGVLWGPFHVEASQGSVLPTDVAIVSDRVVIAAGRLLLGLAATTGALAWSREVEEPSSLGERLLVTAGEPTLAWDDFGVRAFLAGSGSPLWSFGGNLDVVSVGRSGSMLFVSRTQPGGPPDQRVLRRREASTGAPIAPSDLLLPASEYPASDPASVALTPGGELLWCGAFQQNGRRPVAGRLDAKTGAALGAPLSLGPITTLNEPVTCLADSNGTVTVAVGPAVTRYDASDGHVLWGPWTPPSYSGSPILLRHPSGDLLVGSTSGGFTVDRLSAASGTPSWTRQISTLQNPGRLQVSLTGDPIVVTGDSPRVLHLLDGATGAPRFAPITLASGTGVMALSSLPSGDLLLGTRVPGAPGVPSQGLVTRILAATGATAWEHALPVVPDQRIPAELVSDAAGDVYLATTGSEGLDLRHLAGGSGALLDGPVTVPGAVGSPQIRLGADGVLVASSVSGLLASRFSLGSLSMTGEPSLFDGPGTISRNILLDDGSPIVHTDHSGAQALTRLTTGPAVRTSQASLAGAVVGFPYRRFLELDNVVAPVSFSLLTGSLPPGLSLDATTGEISGVPSAAGRYPFRAHVADVTGYAADRDLAIVVTDLLVAGIPGDLDLNSRRDVFDVVQLASHIVGNQPAGVFPFLAPREVADLDGDGDADIFDVLHLMAILVGNESL